MTIIKTGEHYVENNKVTFGYADLTTNVNNAYKFNTDQEAREFISLLYMECNFELITE